MKPERQPRQVDPGNEPARLLVDFHREGDEWRYSLSVNGFEELTANGGASTDMDLLIAVMLRAIEAYMRGDRSLGPGRSDRPHSPRIRAVLPEGTSLAETKRLADELRNVLRDVGPVWFDHPDEVES